MPSSRDSFRRNRVAPDGYNHFSMQRVGDEIRFLSGDANEQVCKCAYGLAGKCGDERGVRENERSCGSSFALRLLFANGSTAETTPDTASTSLSKKTYR